ncbi:vitamin B12 ABC transporter permease BtuC [Serratia microhaemolytica]|uniref:vitamin B12 ABC transporter permease BtuC n=1 Tax=Serratia microhaemolytica TaxID=2675110 RepID=UPI000FDDE275|nr:vitamin B12 ABC transporter permease BtuC [Serratia microhaemolytica]
MPSDSFTKLQQQRQQRDKRYLLLLAISLLLTFILSLSLGEHWIWPWQWWQESANLFIWQIRLPRTLAVVLVGGALATAGATMQALFENPLAEPGLLGIANGSGMALVLTIMLGNGLLPVIWLSGSAILGALLMTILLLAFARRSRLNNANLLLVGVALGILCSAVMTWAVYFSSSLDLRQLMYWMIGSFSGVGWQQRWLLLLLLPLLIWLIFQGNVLNFLSLGEVSAQQLGLPVQRWRNLFVLVIGGLIGISVALAGVIGFIGLVIPHLLRLSGLTNQRFLLPGCLLAGATGLLLADMIARVSLFAAELPIGVVTATLGAPLFIWLLTRSGNTL